MYKLFQLGDKVMDVWEKFTGQFSLEILLPNHNHFEYLNMC